MNEAVSRLSRAWPILSLLVLAAVFALMLFFSRKAPVITSLEPAMAAPGETVVVTGDYFGRTPREGSLSLAGEIPPPSLIRSWSDQKIVFDVPEDAVSGLVTVSNTQGVSQGMLFTNTETIPTVLQTASAPGIPLIVSVYPPRPVSGQTVTLGGRGFGAGSDAAWVRLETGSAALTITPGDTEEWTDREISFVLPAGVGADSFVRVSARADSLPYALQASSPVAFGEPRTVTVEFLGTVSAQRPVTVWGPVPHVPQTRWTAEGATTASWGAGTHDLRYRLTLTSWNQTWSGPVTGLQPAPDADLTATAVWKPAASSLKTLTAPWGLDTADPWQKLQKLQTGLAAFSRHVTANERAALTGDPVQLVAGRSLNSFETSTLAAFVATQAGLSMRLVAGLWLSPDGVLSPRTWTEVWLPGGWIPWDPVDGTPGNLDNRHFAFETAPAAPERRLPRSATWGRPAPATLGDATGEAVFGATASAAEPVVRWEVTRVEK